jgi:site-specific DNA-methyltransferase (adenine-specific)
LTASQADWKNRLFFGDNLKILREEIEDESVDLVYLDPPFNSSASYNVLFAEKNGDRSAAQIAVFEDTWHWGRESEEAYREIVLKGGKAADLLQAYRSFLGQSDMMAYLTMMAPRLIELHRILKGTGSLYLHCDPTASHYLKLLMDAVFGPQFLRNEIIWKRTFSHGNASQRFGSAHDVILFYSKGSKPFWNQQYVPYTDEYLKTKYRYRDADSRVYRLVSLRNPGVRPNLQYEYKGYKPHPNGWAVSKSRMEQLEIEGKLQFPKKPDGRIELKQYLDEMPGTPVHDIWTDINPINSQAQERLGYPTQKPESLLERIINAGSKPGDVILDAFCGCGTAISVSEKLERRWIGIDITHLAITLIRHRLQFQFQGQLSPYEVKGAPTDLKGSAALAELNRYQFEWWALGLVDARPSHDKKKGADRGIDGYIPFIVDNSGNVRRAVVQVKSGHVNRSQIGDLNSARLRERADVAVFITLEKPTKPMLQEAVGAGFYEIDFHRKVPRMQILTIEELLQGVKPELPSWALIEPYKKPPRAEKGKAPEQEPLFAAPYTSSSRRLHT